MIISFQLHKLLLVISLVQFLSSCSFGDYEVTEPPAYDYLIGKVFNKNNYYDVISFRVAREIGSIKEFENRRIDGCILVFGVQKSDGVIKYWRVDSGPRTCYTRRKSFNR